MKVAEMIRNPSKDNAEERFIESFKKYPDNPLKVLFSIYRGNYGKFLLSVFFFFIKYSPVWMSPIILANIINYVTTQDERCVEKITANVILMIFLILLNVPMNYLY